MTIIVISQPESFYDELELVKKLFFCGLEIFHLRKPGFGLREMEQYIQKIPVKFHSRIMLHSHHELIDKYDLRGLHYTEKAREEGEFNNPFLKSTSFHNLSQLNGNNDIFEYVFLSPIFNSISKPGYNAAFENEALRAALRNASSKVIALGGMNKEKMGIVKEFGFDGMALLGGIWNKKSPVQTFQEIYNLSNV